MVEYLIFGNFREGLFSRNLAKKTLSVSDTDKSCPYREFSMSQIQCMCFNAIRENKILAKISEFTILDTRSRDRRFESHRGTTKFPVNGNSDFSMNSLRF